MAYSVQAIKYGWVALTGIVLTGVTIYVASNTRKHVYQKDIIPIPLGIHERCLAAGIATPAFIRTWISNVYTSTGVTTYTNVVTNTIGFYVDREMLVSLDSTIKALVTNYVNTNTLSAFTVTGLWASLGIGDGTNQFTRTPAIGTNPATYGDYPQQIYVTDLQERYKVLNALKYTSAGAPATLNGSHGSVERTGVGYQEDWDERDYSNKITGEIVTGYAPSWQAVLVGRSNDSFFYSNTNYVNLGVLRQSDLSWSEAKQISEIGWYYGITNTPPYQGSNIIVVATNLSDQFGFGVEVGSDTFAHRYPYSTFGTNPIMVWFKWAVGGNKGYATWRWLNVTNNNLNYTLSVWVKPRVNYYGNKTTNNIEIATNTTWLYPRSWEHTMVGEFEEMAGMTEAKYYQIDSSFIRTNGDYLEIEFGSDELDALKLAGTFPAWCSAPDPNAGNFTNNEGVIGYEYGCWLNPQITHGLKEWQFSYCTNKYW